MGLKQSKKKLKDNRESTFTQNQNQEYEDDVVSRLRKDLNENPEMFLVNNILMSFQFYENFEREMEEQRRNQISEREIELNKGLADYQKHCLLPDTVMECINDRVRFRPFHGPKKFESEPLIPQRMFVIHDNIEILYENETAEYSTVDGPVHRAVLQRAENQGYVQLRQVEYLNLRGQNSEEVDSDSEEMSPKEKSSVSFNPMITSSPPSTPGKQRLFTKHTENQFVFSENANGEPIKIVEPKRSSLKNKIFRTHSFSIAPTQPPQKVRETSSVENIHKAVETPPINDENCDENEEGYAYATLRRMTASKPLDEARSHRKISDVTALPSSCIKEVKERRILFDEDSDSDDSLMENGRRRPPKKKKTQDFYETKKYFNSQQFAVHFCDIYELMYPILGFTSEARDKAMFQGGKIYCEGFDRKHNRIMFEIIPTVTTPWPAIVFEWNMRQRPAIPDPLTKKIYQWPTNLMRKKILSFQANLLPLGYIAKRGINVNNELEWSLAFPAAERYMKTCMSHSQIRCYLFILALYKTFMEPTKTKLGLAPHHILNLIFWECERNFLTWPEDRLGMKMIRVLTTLYNHLSKGYLADYFFRDRNLLESCPSKYLRISQSKLHDIIENPAMHVLSAIRNLRYTSGNFFPTLNFKSLYSILTIHDSLALINPSLSVMVENNRDQSQIEERNEFKENSTSFWNNVRKNEDRERKWKRDYRKQIELERKEQEQIKRKQRGSLDSIDLQFPIQKIDSYRRRCLLEFFIIHFMDVALKCYQYESFNYAIILLEHTFSLAILLGEEPSGEVEARPWKKKISELIDRCRQDKQMKPREDNNRESRTFNEKLSVKFNMLDNHNVNMNNLQNSYVKTAYNQEEEGVVLRKKNRPKNLKISADIHMPSVPSVPSVSSPVRSPQNRTSIYLDDNLVDNSTEL